MKKILLTSLISVGALGVYAQGTLEFSDYGSTYFSHIFSPNLTSAVTMSAPVTQDNVSAAAATSFGMPSYDSDSPAGTQTYPGSVLLGGSAANGAQGIFNNGSLWTVQLQGVGEANGTTPVAVSSLNPITQYTTTLDTSGSYTGQFNSPSFVTDPGISGGSAFADVALACWYSGPNTTFNGVPVVGVSSLAAAETTVGAIWGESAEVVGQPLNPPAVPPNPIQPDLETTSFDLTQNSVPEPTTVALGVMAASAFLARRRKS